MILVAVVAAGVFAERTRRLWQDFRARADDHSWQAGLEFGNAYRCRKAADYQRSSAASFAKQAEEAREHGGKNAGRMEHVSQDLAAEVRDLEQKATHFQRLGEVHMRISREYRESWFQPPDVPPGMKPKPRGTL